MKIALLSDIHGNYVAFEECLKYIDNNNFDGVIFLGDYITDCPYPQKTIHLVKQTMKKYKTWCIHGNHEDAMLNHKNNPDEWKYNSQTGDLLNTYNDLTDDDLLFFKNMPISQTIYLTNCKPFVICHGSPNNVRESLIESEGNSNDWLEIIETDYLFCGHTHKPFVYEYNGKKLINCGSVGMPMNNQTNTQFTQIAFADSEWKIRLISLPYNIGALLQDFETSGIYEKYHWWAKLLAKCLQTGIMYPHIALKRALEISNNCNETLNEKHWKQAANELGVE